MILQIYCRLEDCCGNIIIMYIKSSVTINYFHISATSILVFKHLITLFCHKPGPFIYYPSIISKHPNKLRKFVANSCLLCRLRPKPQYIDQCLLEQKHWLMHPTISAARANFSNEHHITFNFQSSFTQIL